MGGVQPDVQGPLVRLTRRGLLRGALLSSSLLVGGDLLVACRSSPTAFRDLLAEQPFVVAHRGGGGDWPEMTAYAYSQAAALKGLTALEVSLCLSADGVLVCSHDPSTLRTTGVDLTIGEQPWSALSGLLVRPVGTLDPQQPSRPLSRFEDVSPHVADHVLFCEPKVTEAAEPLLRALDDLRAPDRVVWKSYVSSPWFAAAKQRGFGTWGYVLDQPSHLGANLERFAASADIDLLGVGLDRPDAFVTAVVEAGRRHQKATMAYPVVSETDRARALALGCTGLMMSRPRELLATS